MKNSIEYALELADLGFSVFPVSSNKTPRCPHGHLDATTSPDTIHAMEQAFGFVLVGVATGTVSNLAVLDIDHRYDGGDWWKANREHLTETRVHRTRDGGMHLWFRNEPGLRCSTARVAPGIDVKAEGGAVIYWPAKGLPVLCDAPLAPWPTWLTPQPKPLPPPFAMPIFKGQSASRRYAEVALQNAVTEVANALPGTRNAKLNAVTYGLLKLGGTDNMSISDIAVAMARAGIAAGLDAREVERTIASALQARGASA